MKNSTAFSFIIFIMVLIIFSGCNNTPINDAINPAHWTLYDIPGITENEIQDIEHLRTQFESFTFAILPGTEAFYTENDEIRGYAALFCQWLTELFKIEFITELHQWNNLFPTLQADFAGELTATEEREYELGYFFSLPIAERSAKYFRIAGSQSRSEIIRTRPLRLAFLDGSTTAIAAFEKLDETSIPFEAFFINDYDTAYNMLLSSEIDAFVEESVAEAAFDVFGNIITEDFLPLIYEPVSLSTQNPNLKPIINVVNKALENGAAEYLRSLYEQGMREYARHKFFMYLDENELAYLRENKVVAYLAEFDNYPLSFFNANENEWQGIAIDILNEISDIISLTFEPVNEPNVSFSDLLEKLENGEGAMISELIRNDVREGRFLWPSNYTMLDNYVIISLSSMQNINVHRVMQMKVGIITRTAYADLFYLWFPNHPSITEYTDSNVAFRGLENGNVDLLMLSMRYLLAATNYLENPSFKANIVFDNTFSSFFGFNINEEILCSIIDKAISIIDVETISTQWMRRTFDYRSKIVEAQRPWLIGVIVMFFIIIILLLSVYLRNRNIGKRLDKLVRQRTMELDAANSAKSAFLATMSHEIRTPMNAIIGVAQIHLQRKDIPSEYADALEKIHSSGNSLLAIINDILDLSKIETGKMEIIPVEYDIPNLIHDTVQLNIIRIGSKQIEFMLDIDENLPLKLIGDEMRLKQILNNLLSNAIKYTEKGYVKLSVSHSEQEVGYIILRFDVEDSGQGMKSEDLKLLFSEYVRFNIENNKATEGTGIGLNITKNLVELMDGTINAESEYGKGSIFTVRIKQKTVECSAKNRTIGTDLSRRLGSFTFLGEKKYVDRQIHREPMPYGKVLIVDDVETNLYVAEGLLSPYNLQIETAISGFTTIEKVKNGNVYDVIFMDHMMPMMDGIETTQELRTLGYDGAIVALTANALVGNEELFKQKGFNGFISKPIDIRHLNAVLNTFVRDKYPEESKKYRPLAEEKLPLQPAINPKLLKIFQRDAEKAIISLQDASASGDIKLFTTTAHAMKSALANIGEHKKSESALALENASLNGDVDFIAANTDNFITSLKNLIKNINSLEISSDDKEGKPDTGVQDTAFLVEQLQNIKSACEDYNDTQSYAALNLLKEKQWIKETSDALEKIMDAIYLHSDFEAAGKQALDLINAVERWRSIEQITGLSVIKGLNTVGERQDIYEKLLKMSIKDIEKCDANLLTFLTSGDIHNFSIMVHGMKGVLDNIGALELSSVAYDLEMAADKMDTAFCTAKLPFFLEELRSLGSSIKKVFEDHSSFLDSPVIPPELYKTLMPIFEKLVVAFDNTNFLAIDDGIEKLSAIETEGALYEEIEKIKDAVLTMDYNSAIEVIQNLTGKSFKTVFS